MENDDPNVERRRDTWHLLPDIDLVRFFKRSEPGNSTLMPTHRINIDVPKQRAFDSGLVSPPDSQIGATVDASKMLFSPPPEEILRLKHPVSSCASMVYLV